MNSFIICASGPSLTPSDCQIAARSGFPVIQQASEYVFVSIPIFTDAGDILRSHHFRKDEHIWYFTDVGIKRWFAEQGFECAEQNTIECQLGRKGVASYAFRRI